MSQARKAISQFLKGHVTRGLRSCLDASELRLALLRERERSDRRDIPFSVLIFQSSRRTEMETEAASKMLFDRLRLTDEVGILDSSNLGILLPDTESDAACHLAAELKSRFTIVRRHNGVLLTRLNVTATPLTNARATGIGQDHATNVLKGLQRTITRNGRANLLRAWRHRQRRLGLDSSVNSLLGNGRPTSHIFI